MKKLILMSLFIIASTTFASECQKPEAQFIGVVSNLYNYQDDYAQIGECHFKLTIKPENYQPSQVPGCALDLNEVLEATFSYEFYHTAGLVTCPVTHEGQEISGYLVKKDGVISID